MVCHYCFFSDWFEFEYSICNGCHDLMIFCLNISDIAIISFKDVGYRLLFMSLANLKKLIS